MTVQRGHTSQGFMSQTAPHPHLQDAATGRPLRVLCVEDSADDHELLLLHLQRGMPDVECLRVDSESQFRNALDQQVWDLVVSDYRLPGFSGLTALSILRASGQVLPFIILSGEIGEDTAVDAMRHGASDYLLKGHTARLLPAIERALQAAEAQRERRRSEVELAQSRARLSELARHLQSSIEVERAAMAREIHDEVGSALTALKFELSWIARHGQQAEVVQRAQRAQEVLDQALSTAQRLMMNLRPAILDQGLLPALQWLCRGFTDRTGVGCELRMPEMPLSMGSEVALAAFRTVQEALTNVSKHASATKVSVDVVHAADMLSIEVTDDGHGWKDADLDKPGSFGIRGLEERALMVGGWLDLASCTSGSTIMLTVPLACSAGTGTSGDPPADPLADPPSQQTHVGGFAAALGEPAR
jgi:signal transduction histidine kinase